MNDDREAQHIARNGFLAYRRVGAGLELAVIPLAFGRARLTIGQALSNVYADSW